MKTDKTMKPIRCIASGSPVPHADTLPFEYVNVNILRTDYAVPQDRALSLSSNACLI